MKFKRMMVAGLLGTMMVVAGTGCAQKTNNQEQKEEVSQKDIDRSQKFFLYTEQKTNLSDKQLLKNEELRSEKYPNRGERGVTSAGPYNWSIKTKEIKELSYGSVDLIKTFEDLEKNFPETEKNKPDQALEWVRNDIQKQLPGFTAKFIDGESQGNHLNAYQLSKGADSIKVEMSNPSDGYGFEMRVYIEGDNNDIQNLIKSSYEHLPKDYSEGTPDTNFYKSPNTNLQLRLDASYDESQKNYRVIIQKV